MAEETEELESGAQSSTAVDPAAIAVALAGASRERADAFLKIQEALTRVQTEHLHEQREVLLSRLKLSRFNEWIKAALQVIIALIGAVIAVGLAVVVWNAGHADGMVVDAFSVPPQFSQNGITGEVVADDLTGRVAAVRDTALRNSIGTSESIRNNSDEDIKVEIPETGISLGQAWQDLRLMLGHEGHLSGNLRLIDPEKIALTVELNGERVAAVSGAAGDLDKLEQQAAERVFARIDPINYVLYLVGSRRDGEVLTAAESAAQMARGAAEQADTNGLWANMLRVVGGDIPLALTKARLAAGLDPKQISAHRELMWGSILEGHDEEALRQAQLMQGLKDKDQPKELRGAGFAEFAAEGAFERDAVLGAFKQAASEDECPDCSQALNLMYRAEFAARAHDGAAYDVAVGEVAAPKPIDSNTSSPIDIAEARYFYDATIGDWSAALSSARSFADHVKGNPSMSDGLKAAILRTTVTPLLAYALARSGDLSGAQATISPTSMDCYDCLRTRGMIAAVAKQWSTADGWFDRAVQAAPSIPFAYSDWGCALLVRGDVDAAIAKFTLATRKGPRFADPLEMWGEALMAKNRSDLALAKFEEANKYAPDWGRLHLKWGEALYYAGKKDEATKQFVRAASFDLTPSEKADLVGMTHG